MPDYLIVLCHADGRAGRAQRTRWWADDAGAVDQAYRWLRLHQRTSGINRPVFDQWVVSRYDHRHLPIIIASGGINDVPPTLSGHDHAHVDVAPPPRIRRPGTDPRLI